MAPLWPGLQGALIVGTALVFPVSSQEVLRMRMSWLWEQLLGILCKPAPLPSLNLGSRNAPLPPKKFKVTVTRFSVSPRCAPV